MKLQGDMLTRLEIVGATATEGSRLALSCPDHLKIDSIFFADFGNPPFCVSSAEEKCNVSLSAVDHCANKVDIIAGFESNAFVTTQIDLWCGGMSNCEIPVYASAFEDDNSDLLNEGERNLTVIVGCSDQYLAKDFLEANLTTCLADVPSSEGGYAISLWVKPGIKSGVQSIFALQSEDHPASFNRAVVKWSPTGSRTNAGHFVYYDDAILSVNSTSEFIDSTWYFLLLSVDSEDNGFLSIDGNVVFEFSTISRPDPGPKAKFFLGMRLGVDLQPIEWFEGSADELRIEKSAITAAEAHQRFQDIKHSPLLYRGCENCCLYVRFSRNLNQSGEVLNSAAGGYGEAYLSSSSISKWPTSSEVLDSGLTLGSIGFQGDEDIHPELVFEGVPWFPPILLSADYQWSELNQSSLLWVEGINFAPGIEVNTPMIEDLDRVNDGAIMMTIAPDVELSEPLNKYLAQEKRIFPEAIGENIRVSSKELSLLEKLLVGYCYADSFAKESFGIVDDSVIYTADRNAENDEAILLMPSESLEIRHLCEATGNFTIALIVAFDDVEPNTNAYKACSQAPKSPITDFHYTSKYPNTFLHLVLTRATYGDDDLGQGDIYATYLNGIRLSTCSLEEIMDDDCDAYALLLYRAISDQTIAMEDGGIVDELVVWEEYFDEQEIYSLYSTKDWAAYLDINDTIVLRDRLTSAETVSNDEESIPAGSEGLLAVYKCIEGACDQEYVAEIVQTVNFAYGASGPPVLGNLSSTDRWSVDFYGWVASDVGTTTFSVSTPGTSNSFTLSVAGASVTAPVNTLTVVKSDSPGYLKFKLTYLFEDGDDPANLTLSISPLPTTTPSKPLFLTDSAHAFTLSMWIKPVQLDDVTIIASRRWHQKNSSGVQEPFPPSVVDLASFYNHIRVEIACESAVRVLEAVNAVIAPLEWVHLSMTYDGKAISVSINCVETDRIEFEQSCFPFTESFPGYEPKWVFFPLTSDSETHSATSSDGVDAGSDIYDSASRALGKFIGEAHSISFWPFAMDGNSKAMCDCPTSNANSNQTEVAILKLGKPFDQWLDVDRALSAGRYIMNANLSTFTNATSPKGLSTGLDAEATLPEASSVFAPTADTIFAGESGYVYVTTRTACHRRSYGGDDVVAKVMGPLLITTSITTYQSIDNNDGSYTIELPIVVAGEYKVQIMVQGHIVRESDLIVKPGPIDSSVSTFGVPTHGNKIIAGLPYSLHIDLLDAFGNAVMDYKLAPSVSMTEAIPIWAIFDGPSTFNISDNAIDLGNGTVVIPFTLPVQGTYELSVATCHNRYMCNGKIGNVDAIANATAPGPCAFCIDVIDGFSISLQGKKPYLSVPDGGLLSFDSEFSIHAWIQPRIQNAQSSWGASEPISPDEAVDYPDKMYILRKQSQSTGKGHWFALRSTHFTGLFEIEAGVYVGSDTYRIVKSTPIDILEDKWIHVAFTYDGRNGVLYYNGNIVAQMEFDYGRLRYGRSNNQMTTIGEDFKGSIDEVRIYDKAVPPTMLQDRMCPALVQDDTVLAYENPLNERLRSYFRFNDYREIDPSEPYSPWSLTTFDSGSNGLVSFFGLECETANENRTLTISCPRGFVIGEVLFANFGYSEGTCGLHSAIQGCTAFGSKSVIEDMCIGSRVCKVNASTTETSPKGLQFGKLQCEGKGPITLTVDALCAPAAPDDAIVRVKGAPTVLGEIGTVDISCSMPELSTNASQVTVESPSQCSETVPTNAVAGTTYTLTLDFKDMCGFKIQRGQGLGVELTIQYSKTIVVSNTVEDEAGLLGPSQCFPLMVESANLTSSTAYPPYEQSWCSILQQHSQTISFTPTVAATSTVLRIIAESSTIYEGALQILPNVMSASYSKVAFGQRPDSFNSGFLSHSFFSFFIFLEI